MFGFYTFDGSVSVELLVLVLAGQCVIMFSSVIFGFREWRNQRRGQIISSCVFVFLIAGLTITLLLADSNSSTINFIPESGLHYLTVIRDMLIVFFVLGIGENWFIRGKRAQKETVKED